MRDTEAAHWLMRLQGDDVPQTEVDAWLDWCHADPRNLDAFDRVQNLYEGLRAAGDVAREDFLQLAEQVSAEPATRRLTARAWRLAATSMVAAVCGVALLLWIFRPLSAPAEQAQYRAERGGQRDFKLVDHSRVVLSSDSVLSSQYSATRRLLKLARGEAYFEVEEDPGRPFVVEAGSLIVTATGTAFNVRRTSERTVVSVTEGTVKVARSAARLEPLVRLQDGQELVYSEPDARFSVVQIDPATVMARQRGVLLYTSEPLGSVLEDVSRYAPNPIVATDEKVRALNFAGMVNLEHAEAFVLALERIFPVRVIRREDGSIVVEPLPPVAR